MAHPIELARPVAENWFKHHGAGIPTLGFTGEDVFNLAAMRRQDCASLLVQEHAAQGEEARTALLRLFEVWMREETIRRAGYAEAV
jgi:hypothetical protein